MGTLVVALLLAALGLTEATSRSLTQEQLVVEAEPIAWVAAGAKFLVPEAQLILTYHNGPILSGETPVYLIWYGNFSDSQRSIVTDFFSSTGDSTCVAPNVHSWWNMTAGYKTLDGGVGLPPSLRVAAELRDDGCSSHGTKLMSTDLEALVVNSLTTFPADANAVYVVLTAHDVQVEQMCSNQCGSHFATPAVDATSGKQLAYAWVGNPALQCAGLCAWPFAQPEYGPAETPLLPPNGDVGIDGMVINIASILAGTVTNPFNSGFYQGDGAAPLEAATACTGMFGAGAYAGYAGQLMHDESTGDSYNAWGVNGRRFLLPAMWDPLTLDCTPPRSAV